MVGLVEIRPIILEWVLHDDPFTQLLLKLLKSHVWIKMFNLKLYFNQDEVSQLEFDVEIQKKIVHAARRRLPRQTPAVTVQLQPAAGNGYQLHNLSLLL